MLKRILFLALLTVLSHSFIFGQSDKLPVYEDKTAYEVYSAILTLQEAKRSEAKNFVIRGETLRNFGAFIDGKFNESICLRPDEESAKVIGTAVEDFKKVNQTKWRLQEKFKLEIPYKLVGTEKVISLIKPMTDDENWDEFYKQYPDSGGFVDVSAVGFNADKTVAVVSKGRWCGSLCGEGQYYVLQKVNGEWIPLKWSGELCSWIS